jgi:hypothetical protein
LPGMSPTSTQRMLVQGRKNTPEISRRGVAILTRPPFHSFGAHFQLAAAETLSSEALARGTDDERKAVPILEVVFVEGDEAGPVQASLGSSPTNDEGPADERSEDAEQDRCHEQGSTP